MRDTRGLWRWMVLFVMLYLIGTATGSAGQANRPPSAAETRKALRDAASKFVADRIMMGQLRDAVDESVTIQIDRCQRVKSPQGEDPDVTEHERRQLPKDANTNMMNIQSQSKQYLDPFRKRAESLRRYLHLHALPPRQRLQLDRAIALLLGAEQAYAMGFQAYVQATIAISNDLNCDGALAFRGKADPHFKDGDVDLLDAQKILDALAKEP